MTILAVIPAADFLITATFASTDERRPHLKCVNVEPLPGGAPGCAMVATQGQALGALRLDHDAGQASAPVMISTAKDILRAVKGSARECLYMVCRDTGMDVVIADSCAAAVDNPVVKSTIPATAAYLSGLTFPQWRKVLPEKQSGTRTDVINEEPTRPAAINPDLLRKFAAFGEFISFDWNGLGPISVATSDQRFYGVVMPACCGLSAEEIAERRALVMCATPESATATETAADVSKEG